jgi:hypothetical protein
MIEFTYWKWKFIERYLTFIIKLNCKVMHHGIVSLHHCTSSTPCSDSWKTLHTVERQWIQNFCHFNVAPTKSHSSSCSISLPTTIIFSVSLCVYVWVCMAWTRDFNVTDFSKINSQQNLYRKKEVKKNYFILFWWKWREFISHLHV